MVCYCEDPADVWEEKQIQAARKEHTCGECGETIEVGEPYTSISSLYRHEGRWHRERICQYCWHDWKLLSDAGHCIMIGGLQETWEEYWEPTTPKIELSPTVVMYGAPA